MHPVLSRQRNRFVSPDRRRIPDLHPNGRFAGQRRVHVDDSRTKRALRPIRRIRAVRAKRKKIGNSVREKHVSILADRRWPAEADQSPARDSSSAPVGQHGEDQSMRAGHVQRSVIALRRDSRIPRASSSIAAFRRARWRKWRCSRPRKSCRPCRARCWQRRCCCRY